MHRNSNRSPGMWGAPEVLSRVEKHADLHAGLLTTRQSLKKALGTLGA